MRNGIVELEDLTTKDIAELTSGFQVPLYKRMHFGSASLDGGALQWPDMSKVNLGDIPMGWLVQMCHYEEAIPSITRLRFDGKRILILGSSKPWLELLCFQLGADEILTVEYRKINWSPPADLAGRWTSSTFDEILQPDVQEALEGYDVFLSYSSLEHSGLGRYGDSFDANGDLKTLGALKSLIVKNGVWLIAIPLGSDSVLFNRHRVYGERRLAALGNVIGRSKVRLIAPTIPEPIPGAPSKPDFASLLTSPAGSDGIQRLLMFS